MSWRTRGTYRGLTKSAREWLRRFDRAWDSREEGRIRDDAFDHRREKAGPHAMRPKADLRRPRLEVIADPAAEPGEPVRILEGDELKLIVKEVSRFTVPRATSRGYSIHLVLRSGERVRAHFEDRAEAQQAYGFLLEAFKAFSKP